MRPFWTRQRKKRSLAIKNAEETRRTFAHLARLRNKNKKGALRYLLIPDTTEATGWKGVYDPQEVTDTLFRRNEKHFSQAEGTPFTVDPLLSLFGRHGDTAAAKRLNRGQQVQAETTEAAQAILDFLKEERLPPVDTHITPEQLRQVYKKWDEGTSTAGNHLGHNKTIARQRPSVVKEGEDRILNISEKYLLIEAIKSNIALQNGYVFERWKTVTSLMLEKWPGIPRLDKLRVIHLFEADLNILFGIIWNRRLDPT